MKLLKSYKCLRHSAPLSGLLKVPQYHGPLSLQLPARVAWPQVLVSSPKESTLMLCCICCTRFYFIALLPIMTSVGCTEVKQESVVCPFSRLL